MNRVRQRLGEQERRQQILRAVVAVVAEQGFDAASASAIAAEAGVSKGLIWRYFADKTELMRQAVVETVALVMQEVADAVDQGQPVPERIRAYVRSVARLKRERMQEFRAMDRISARLEHADGSAVFSARDYEQVHAGQEELFRQGQVEGSLRDFDARVMAVSYQGAVDAMLAYLDVHPEVDAEQYADALADLLLAAMERRSNDQPLDVDVR